jgi:hypothetical protein
MDWRDFSWRTASPLAKRLIVSAGIVILVVGAYLAGKGGSAPSGPAAQGTGSERASQPPADATGPLQTASAPGTGPTPLTELSSGPCRTFAPEGWKITDQNKEGTVLTVTSADGSLTGAYGGLPVSSGQVQGLYGPQFRSPEALTAYLIKALANEDPKIDASPETIGIYQATRFTTASHAGYVLSYRFAIPGDPGGFGLILRIAIGRAGDEHSVGVAGAAAAAIRCSAVLHPPEGPVYHAPSSSAAHGADRAGGSDNDMAGTYNAQLGTGWVHDPNTGQNYNVDVAGDWRENGPSGAGYYKQNGNDVTKLEPGMN